MEFKQITRGELKKKMDAHEDFALIDTLGEGSYQNIHLPGALMIDAHKEDFAQKVLEAVPDKLKEVIVYCASFSCQLSPKAARMLADAGYAKVFDFKGGLKDWAEAGYPFKGEKVEETKERLTQAENKK